MSENNNEYASLRVRAETNRKLKVLSGLMDASAIDIVEKLVDSAYTVELSMAAKGISKAESKE